MIGKIVSVTKNVVNIIVKNNGNEHIFNVKIAENKPIYEYLLVPTTIVQRSANCKIIQSKIFNIVYNCKARNNKKVLAITLPKNCKIGDNFNIQINGKINYCQIVNIRGSSVYQVKVWNGTEYNLVYFYKGPLRMCCCHRYHHCCK